MNFISSSVVFRIVDFDYSCSDIVTVSRTCNNMRKETGCLGIFQSRSVDLLIV